MGRILPFIFHLPFYIFYLSLPHDAAQAMTNDKSHMENGKWNQPHYFSLAAYFAAIPCISKCAPRSKGPEPMNARAGKSFL